MTKIHSIGSLLPFKQVQVTLPDGSSQTDTYGSTDGWGIFSSSITCYTGGTCDVEPYNVIAVADGIGSDLIDFSSVDPMPVFMAATPDFVDKKPDVVPDASS